MYADTAALLKDDEEGERRNRNSGGPKKYAELQREFALKKALLKGKKKKVESLDFEEAFYLLFIY